MQIGKWFGVPVRLDWTFLVLLGLKLITGGVYATMNFVVLVFTIILHEFGHVFAARAFNLKVKDITVYPFGGIAQIDIGELKPLAEFIVAIAGPAVNVFLTILGIGVYLGCPHEAIKDFIVIQAIIVLFNLGSPVFPSDGGRVLRSFLHAVTGSFLRSTWLAVRFGQVFAGTTTILLVLCNAYVEAAVFGCIYAILCLGGEAELYSVDAENKDKAFLRLLAAELETEGCPYASEISQIVECPTISWADKFSKIERLLINGKGKVA